MTEEIQPQKRRIRYHGTHPRRFKEKYKELDPDRYAQDVKKVIERRQTPAGTHIPICVEEILTILDPQPGETGLDATLGFGGHATALLNRILPGGRLFGIDADPLVLPETVQRMRNEGFTEAVFNARRLNFAGILQLLGETNNGFDFILADLGVSSMQIDNPARGFTFKEEGPLDLRLNPTRGMTAAQLIKNSDEKVLAALLIENADEPFAAEIAHTLFLNKGKITTTTQLAEKIRTTLSDLPQPPAPNALKKSLQRAFQALRIAVNDEFGVLEQFLKNVPWCLKPHGRIAVLTFHSGEDRRVLSSFEKGLTNGIYEDISHTPVRPSTEEQFLNPRSTSAKLRWAIASRKIEKVMNRVIV